MSQQAAGWIPNISQNSSGWLCYALLAGKCLSLRNTPREVVMDWTTHLVDRWPTSLNSSAVTAVTISHWASSPTWVKEFQWVDRDQDRPLDTQTNKITPHELISLYYYVNCAIRCPWNWTVSREFLFGFLWKLCTVCQCSLRVGKDKPFSNVSLLQ